MPNGSQVIAEMARLAKKRVIVFSAAMEFRSPLNSGRLSRLESKIAKIENRLFRPHTLDVQNAEPQAGILSWQQIPKAMSAVGLKQLRVRGMAMSRA